MHDMTSIAPEPKPVKKRGPMEHVGRVFAWLIGSLLLLVIVVVGGFCAVLLDDERLSTADGQGGIVLVLEDATGGRVELRGMSSACGTSRSNWMGW